MQIPQTGTNVQFIVVYGEPGCFKRSTIGCFRSAWDFRQTLLWRRDGGGGNRWMDEMLSSRIPRSHRGGSRRPKPSMRAYWILQVEINPLKFTPGGILRIATIPTSTAKKTPLWRQSVIVSKSQIPTWSWNLVSDMRKATQVSLTGSNARAESIKTVLMQQRMTAGTYVTLHHKPQFSGCYGQWGGELCKISATRVSQQNHWAISTDDLSLLVFIVKLRRRST